MAPAHGAGEVTLTPAHGAGEVTATPAPGAVINDGVYAIKCFELRGDQYIFLNWGIQDMSLIFGLSAFILRPFGASHFGLRQALGSRHFALPPGRHGTFRASQPPSGAVCASRASVCALYVLLGVPVRLWALVPLPRTLNLCGCTLVRLHTCVPALLCCGTLL